MTLLMMDCNSFNRSKSLNYLNYSALERQVVVLFTHPPTR